MKIKLLRDARIRHKAGETVDASPAEAGFLLSTGSAVRVTVNKAQPTKSAEKPKTKTK